MKKVLWISRHEMTQEQRSDLDRITGGAELLLWKETVTDIAKLLPLLQQADAVAAVLPPELLAELLALAGDKPVLRGERAEGHGALPHPAGRTARAGVRLCPRRLGAAPAHGRAITAALSCPLTEEKTASHRTLCDAAFFAPVRGAGCIKLCPAE